MKKLLAALIVFVAAQVVFAQDSFINGLAHNGVEITCDLPGSQHIKNIGSHIDGAGMCVFSSIEMAALHAGMEQMRGWRNWCAERFSGGGWPERVDDYLDKWFTAKKISPIPYIQYQGKNPETVLDLCEKTGRMAGITYGYSPRYGGKIQHMTDLVMFNKDFGVVLDNNFPGEDRYEWVARKELIRRTIYPNKSAWVFVWLHPGPPPSPKNKARNS